MNALILPALWLAVSVLVIWTWRVTPNEDPKPMEPRDERRGR
ncbi:hypothetical protein [uncultured Phenylobacterium sp.]|nr:hypothetical protein [uncultured Phenylobacterium sp.]